MSMGYAPCYEWICKWDTVKEIVGKEAEDLESAVDEAETTIPESRRDVRKR